MIRVIGGVNIFFKEGFLNLFEGYLEEGVRGKGEVDNVRRKGVFFEVSFRKG